MAVVLLLMAGHVLAPQRSGVIALTQVFEPYIVFSAGVALALALVGRWRPALYLGAIFLAVVLVRYGPAWLSFPQATDGPEVAVAAWNVLAGPNATQRTMAGLRTLGQVDIIGLVELQPAMAQALQEPGMAARYPHWALAPDASVMGVGLISRFPIMEHRSSHDPPFMRAVIDTPHTVQPTVVYVLHPLPARIASLGRIPIALETAARDAALAEIRALIQADLDRGTPVIALGDLNTTEREPAYTEFLAGLRDAHVDAGLGPGFTWRPSSLAGLPFGLLRIDYVLVSAPFSPTASAVTCLDASDHCLISATLEIATSEPHPE